MIKDLVLQIVYTKLFFPAVELDTAALSSV